MFSVSLLLIFLTRIAFAAQEDCDPDCYAWPFDVDTPCTKRTITHAEMLANHSHLDQDSIVGEELEDLKNKECNYEPGSTVSCASCHGFYHSSLFTAVPDNCPSDCAPSSTTKDGVRIKDTSYDQVIQAAFELCIQHCEREEKCRKASWDSTTGLCYLMGSQRFFVEIEVDKNYYSFSMPRVCSQYLDRNGNNGQGSCALQHNEKLGDETEDILDCRACMYTSERAVMPQCNCMTNCIGFTCRSTQSECQHAYHSGPQDQKAISIHYPNGVTMYEFCCDQTSQGSCGDGNLPLYTLGHWDIKTEEEHEPIDTQEAFEVLEKDMQDEESCPRMVCAELKTHMYSYIRTSEHTIMDLKTDIKEYEKRIEDLKSYNHILEQKLENIESILMDKDEE